MVGDIRNLRMKASGQEQRLAHVTGMKSCMFRIQMCVQLRELPVGDDIGCQPGHGRLDQRTGLKHLWASRIDGFATKAPRFFSMATSPEWASACNAARTTVRLTP